MEKKRNAIQLPGGIILCKPDLVNELLVRINETNIFLEERFPEEKNDDGYWLIILPDAECYWDWFDGHLCGYSRTGNNAFYRRSEGHIIKLAPCIEGLIKASATMSPQEFTPVIKRLGEEKIVQELEKLAVKY